MKRLTGLDWPILTAAACLLALTIAGATGITHFDDAKIIAEVSKGLGAPMRGIAMEAIPDSERLAVRGW